MSLSFLGFWKQKAKRRQIAAQAWNECLDKVQELLGEHRWVVDEEDPQTIFCDVCGQDLTQALEQMRR